MGSKRVGLARTQALINNLRRELNLENSTFKSGTLEKFTVRGLADDASGDGMQSGSTTTAPITRVQNINGEIITSYAIDLQDLSGSGAGTTNKIIGRPGAQETDSSGSYPAYLMQWDEDVNGICYRVELSCIEGITGGNANKHFVLSSSTLGTYEHSQVPTGDPTDICDFGSDIAVNQTQTVNTPTSPGDDEYIYIVNGATGGAAGKFSTGKLILRFYGHKDF
jgi:hypothetical protein